MAVVTHGGTLPDSSQKTDFYGIVDNATVSSIIDADISSSASIQDSKLNTISTAGKVNVSSLIGQIANTNLAQLVNSSLVSGAALTLLPNIPSGAGIIPSANIGNLLGSWTTKNFGTTYQATTDLLVIVTATSSFPAGSTANIFSDSNSSPSTLRAVYSGPATTYTTDASIITPVRKNDYYEATESGVSGPVMYILSIGS